MGKETIKVRYEEKAVIVEIGKKSISLTKKKDVKKFRQDVKTACQQYERA